MKNKAFKLVLTIVIAGVLIFGASFGALLVKAQTSDQTSGQTSEETMVATLRALIQVLMQMLNQLLAQRGLPPVSTTTITTIIQQNCDAICKSKGYETGSCDCALGDFQTPPPINIGSTLDCACTDYEQKLRESDQGGHCGTCCCRAAAKYSCISVEEQIAGNLASHCKYDPNGQFTSLAECEKTCKITSTLPDLIISNLSANKTSAAINEKITISVTEKNIGLGTANPHYVIVTEENKEGVFPIFVFNSQPLAPGESFTASGTFSCYYPGEHILTAKTNYKQAAGIVNITGIQEANETNNTKTITINCTGSTDYKCTDSDGGTNYYVKGYTRGYKAFWDKVPQNFVTEEDFCTTICQGSVGSGKASTGPCLVEFYCDGNNYAAFEAVTCPSGYTCQDGACKPTVVTTIPSYGRCTDGSTCAWCGNQCTKYISGTQCSDIAPPTGATCTCVNNTCTIQYANSALLNSLNSLTASLSNLLEFLKR